MNIRISVNSQLRKEVLERLNWAIRKGAQRLVKRVLAILDVLDGISLEEVAYRWELNRGTVKQYVIQFIVKGMASLAYKRPPGRPPKLTKNQRKELCKLIDAGPEAAGYDYGCWTTGLIKQMIKERFGVGYRRSEKDS